MFNYITYTLLSQNQDTPAHIAAYRGHVDILRTLHNNGAELNTKNKVSMCDSIIVPVMVLCY